jgi:histone H1/5
LLIGCASDGPELARKMHRRGTAEERVARRTVTDKGMSERNGAAAVSDPRQLELALALGAARANGNGNGKVVRVEDPSGVPAAHAEEVERARTIVASLDSLSSEEVFAAFEELDGLPPEAVRLALGVSGLPARFDEAIRRAHGFPEPPLVLRTISAVKDADIFDLGSPAEEQVRLAGISWDGRDLAAEERLDEEVDGTFAGTLEHRVLVDAESPSQGPVFDVILYAGDAGAVFRAGTTELVGAITYGTVEMKDRRARVAIQAALAAPFVEPVPETRVSAVEPAAEEVEVEAASAEPAPPPKKAAAKKAAATKAAAKKAAATKPTAETEKKPAAKKVAAKTPAEKKRAASEAPPKKVASKKKATASEAPAKTTTEKKAVAKKVAAKVPAAKVPAAKKVAAKAPAAKKVAAKTPAAKTPAAKTPAAKTPAAKTPAAKKAAAKKPAAKKGR